MKTGLYGWLNKNMKGRKGQQGFTLIELLVVVTILGVLAAIVTLSLVGLTTNASAQACNTEYKTVQAALDAAMANNSLSGIAAFGPTNDMTKVLATNVTGAITPDNPNGNVTLFNSKPAPNNPNYTRNGTTQFYYDWNSAGKITAIWTDSAGTKTLGGCAVLS
jgi:prepilin-type N-terminal cleavage/methylation domain-containing protein